MNVRNLVLTAVLAATAFTVTKPAQAVGALVDVQVLDRTTGETLPVTWHQGRYWVPGRPGSRYAVTLTNRAGGRMLAVLSVDGVNVITGETAAAEQSGYVLAPGQFAQITGWRKDLTRVAAFEFTALPNSYAARTGRPDNVGVIGVALFRERAPLPVPPVASARGNRQEAARDSAAAPAAGAAGNASEGRMRAEEAQPQQKLGTGHGRQESSPTRSTEFERAQTTPDEIVTIAYDSRDNLIALGVIAAPRPRPVPNPFPAAAGFVPDPR
jgi:hypothetical protein